MDAHKILTKLKELGHVNSKRVELQEYCSNKFDQILQLLPRSVLNSDGADILDCVFSGLTDSSPVECRNKVKVIDIVLTVMRKESTSLTHCGDVISRLCLELPRIPVGDLVRWSNDSVQSIVDNNDVNMIWRDVLPECTTALNSYDTVRHCDTDMPTDEYKEQCVHTLCQCRWNEQQLVQLAAMFKDMQLSKTSHKQVVNKICTYIIDLHPDTLPPLVHQLLKLCKVYHLEVVLSHLSYYFSARLYSKLEPPPQDSESTTMDIDDIVPHSPAELSRCLSTCIYHISQGAVEPDLVKKHIKSWPRTQLLRAPFIIDLALAISDKGTDFRSVCLDAIKSAIEQRITDDLRSKESAWVRSVIPPDVDVASVLKVLTTESANHRQLTVVGLINLAFSLLAVNKLKPAAITCWSHGKLILVRLCKSQPETAGHILSQLADRLATDCTQKQYSDCLYILCKLTPLSLERCTQLSTILENCQPAGAEYKSAAAVLDAVHPLLNFSTRTRDVLVMVCRKGLYSRESPHRCVSLAGFLSVLRHARVAAAPSDDGDLHSAHSYLTQLTVDLHATQQGTVVTSRIRNEAMCMEVVSILRRCLVQDAAVKELLYSDIYDCAKEKPVLHESILELLYEHLIKYIPEDHNNATLLWDKCVQISGATAVLTEPISRLLYAIAQFLQPADDDDTEDILSSQCVETASAHLKSKLNSIMNKLCSNTEFGKIDLEDPSLTDLTPESKAKALKVQQILQCYEALIAHQIMQCTANSIDVGTSVCALFKSCHQLLEQTKAPPKLGKKGSKSLNETRDTVKSQKSQKSQKDKPKAPVKVANLVKDRSGPFKPLPSVWDMKFCVRIMELLYGESVPWCPANARTTIVSSRDLHRWALRGVATGNTQRRDAPHTLTVTALVYSRCVCRFGSMCEFDEQTALACLELFKSCLLLLLSNNYSLKLDSFLPKITGLSDTTPSTNIACILEHVHTAMMQLDSEVGVEERDLMSNKMLSALSGIATVLLEVPVLCCVNMCNVLVKFEDFVRTSKQDCLSLIPAILTAGCREYQESQLLDDLLMKLSEVLGKVDEEESSVAEETTSFPTIDSRTGHNVLNFICAHLNNRLKGTDHLLHRARDLATALGNATRSHAQRIERELHEAYKCIIIQLCQASGWVCACAKLRCCVGGGSDRVLGTCVKLYSVLAALVKQIDVAVAQNLRIERLLKLSGKKLSTVTDNLITYLEASQSQQNATKVLRDTKLIPRLVLEAEQYSKNVILLSNKAKVNWHQYLSLGTARDFRIKGPVLEEVLNARDHIVNDTTRDEDGQHEDINDAATEIISPIPSDQEDEDNTKRRRLS